jgi:uncharacterized membrane protein
MAPARTPAWQVALAWAALVALYCAISLLRYRHLESTSFDLAVFVQIVDDWARLRVPEVELTYDSVLASRHFSPGLVVLAPLYALFPSPVVLLVQQAVLVATGLVPLMRHAGRYGRLFPWAVAFAYGLAPGLVSLVGFDVHEVALAVPLLAFSMTALLEQRHRAAVLWALPLLLVKEDLGLTLAAIGVVVLLRGSRVLGALTTVVGLVATALVLLWVQPVLDRGPYFYGESFAPGSPGEAWQTLRTMWPTKLETVGTLLLPVAFLAVASPLALVAIPTLAWRFVADRQTYAMTGFHYDAVLVPVVVAALLDVVGRFPRRLLVPVAVAMVALTALTVPRFDAGELLRVDRWDAPARTGEVLATLAVIPDGATVAASNDLGPRLVSRTELYFFGDVAAELGPVTDLPDFQEIDWIAYDTAYDSVVPGGREKLDELVASGRYEVVAEGGGVVVAQRVARRVAR